MKLLKSAFQVAQNKNDTEEKNKFGLKCEYWGFFEQVKRSCSLLTFKTHMLPREDYSLSLMIFCAPKSIMKASKAFHAFPFFSP
jgi:hypothetical protein